VDAFRRQRGGDLPRYRAMLASQDAKEGPRAFAEKRAAIWQAR
jgi:crotonobetainyl-CoA hydratase